MIITVSKTLMLNESDVESCAVRIAKAIAAGYSVVVHSGDGGEKKVWKRVDAILREGGHGQA